MRHSILYIGPVAEYDARHEHYRFVCQGIDSKVVTAPERKLGESSWLISSDNIPPLLVEWGEKIRKLTLKVEVFDVDENAVWRQVA